MLDVILYLQKRMLSGIDWVVVDYNDQDTWPPNEWIPIWVREKPDENPVLETLRRGIETYGELKRGRVGILEWKLFED